MEDNYVVGRIRKINEALVLLDQKYPPITGLESSHYKDPHPAAAIVRQELLMERKELEGIKLRSEADIIKGELGI